MLQQMRSAAKYIWLFIVVAFVGGFLLAETSGLLGRTPVTPTTAVAKVNGKEILYTDWRNRVQQATQNQQRNGRSLTQDEVRQIENDTFDEMVMQALLEQEYRKRGIGVSDEELREFARYAPPPFLYNAPDLQTEGRFDPQKYPMTGAEDFSFVLERVPGAFLFLGACPPDRVPATAPFNHSAEAVFDDAVLTDGAALYAELALRRLAAS